MNPAAPGMDHAVAYSSGAAAAAGGPLSRSEPRPGADQRFRSVRAQEARRTFFDPLSLALPLALAGAWEYLSRSGTLDRSLFSSPSEVLSALRDAAASGGLWIHIGATSLRVAWGFLAGAAAATLLGTLTGTSTLLRRLLDPVLQSIRSIPSLAWVPLFILWLGIGETPRITLIALGSFFPVYLSLVSGILGVDRKLVEAGLACRKRGWRLIREVYLPATLPAYHVGLRSGLGLAWMFVVAAEIMGASRGVGYMLVDGQATGRPAIMIASILLFALLGRISDSMLILAGAPWLRWQDTYEKKGPR